LPTVYTSAAWRTEMKSLIAIYHFLDKQEIVVFRAIERIIVVLMTLTLCSVAFQVIHRFIIIKLVHFPFPYSDEFSRYSIVLIVYLAIPFTLRESSQPTVDLLKDYLPSIGKNILYLVIKSVILFCLAILLFNSIEVVRTNFFTSPTLGIPGNYLYSMPLIGIILMLFDWVTDILGFFTGQKPPFKMHVEQEN
jgi:TRAP-type C4-dicarboxylate transport system permease small subunit